MNTLKTLSNLKFPRPHTTYEITMKTCYKSQHTRANSLLHFCILLQRNTCTMALCSLTLLPRRPVFSSSNFFSDPFLYIFFCTGVQRFKSYDSGSKRSVYGLRVGKHCRGRRRSKTDTVISRDHEIRRVCLFLIEKKRKKHHRVARETPSTRGRVLFSAHSCRISLG